MATKGGKRSSGPDNSSLILGILIGMVLGLLVAGAVAWHLSNRPKAFSVKDTREAPHEAAATPPKAPPAASGSSAGLAASAVGPNGKRFTFYEILTDKDHQAAHNNAHASGAPKDRARAAAGGSYFLQAGSFAKADEADRLKAKLAFMGMEAAVQSADVPGKGTYYRVRLGPYRSTEDMNKANATLKENGITNAAPVRGGR